MKTEHASMQYSIRPFSDFLEEELLKFARSCPDQWQVKILLLLSFKNIRSLDDIASNCSFPDLCILKALLVAQEYNLVLNISNGWLLNEKLYVEYLNQYLSIDILDHKLLAEDVFKRKLAQNNVSQEVKASKHEKGDTLTSDYNFTLKAHYAQRYNNSYDDLARNERSVDGYGRKRRNEWNNTEALSLNKEVRNRIKKLNAERNEAYNATHSQAKTSTSSRKYSEKSEKLYAELCTEFPEYEDYIDRCHKIDPSYGQMLQVKMKIYADNGYDKFGMRNEDWNIGRFSE